MSTLMTIMEINNTCCMQTKLICIDGKCLWLYQWVGLNSWLMKKLNMLMFIKCSIYYIHRYPLKVDLEYPEKLNELYNSYQLHSLWIYNESSNLNSCDG